jgi:hypothetical protein
MERDGRNDGADIIRKLIKAGKYEFSIHAEKERQADKITMEELNLTIEGWDTLSRPVKSPLAPLYKGGDRKMPPLVKGAAQSAGGFASGTVPTSCGPI